MGRLGDLPATVLIEGRIVYRRKQKDSERYMVGVEFIEFVNTTRDEVLRHIDLWCKKGTASADETRRLTRPPPVSGACCDIMHPP